MKTSLLLSTAMVSVSVAVSVTPGQAATITNLYNTGVDNSGTALGSSVIDPHYTLVVSPAGTVTPAVTVPDGFPIPPWIANTTTSRWIGPNTDSADGPVGDYTYRTTFTLSSFVTASITGQWSTDNAGLDILINGISTGFTTSFENFGNLNNFSISSGFVVGTNTLEFRLNNGGGGGPTGLRVANIQGTFTPAVPEPSTILGSLAIGLLGAGSMFKKRHD